MESHDQSSAGTAMMKKNLLALAVAGAMYPKRGITLYPYSRPTWYLIAEYL